jgi:outer membrane protein
MKKLFIVLGIVLCAIPAFAQKFGYVDADFILSKMPSYQKSQQDIEQAAQKWEEDIRKKFEAVEKLRKDLQAEELLLTEEMKAERLEEINKLYKEAADYQKKIFGYKGLFFSRQQELMKPAQEELHKALEKVVRKNKLQFIFSNTEGLTILYAEPRHDYTEEVLEVLGLKEEKQAPEEKTTTPNTPNNTKNTTIPPKKN